MAQKQICTSCLRTLLRQQSRNAPKHHLQQGFLPIAHRTFTTSTPRLKPATAKTPPPPPTAVAPPSSPDTFKTLASSLRNTTALRGATEPYLAYGGTEDLFKQCLAQCDYTIPNVFRSPPEPPPKTAEGEDIGVGTGEWYAPKRTLDGTAVSSAEMVGEGMGGPAWGLGLDVTFNTWAQVMYLHMYILTVRLRTFPAAHARTWHQNLLDHFFYAAEDRMVTLHNISSRGVRNRYLKDLLQQWRGILLSYDEGLIKGDAVLATAIWRNLFNGKMDASVEDVAVVTAYVRAQILNVEKLSDAQIAGGEVKFGGLEKYRNLIEGMQGGARIGEGEVEAAGVMREQVMAV